MSELWLLTLIPALAWILARLRARRLLAAARVRRVRQGEVSAEEMGRLVKDLSSSIQPHPKVTSPHSIPEQKHVWSSPSGKRVYIN